MNPVSGAIKEIIDGVIVKHARKVTSKRGPQKCEAAGGKYKYDGREKAERCAEELWTRLGGFEAQKRFYAYVCPDSGNPKYPHWHLTSMQTASMPEVTPIPVAVMIGKRRVLVHSGPGANEPLPEEAGGWVWKPRRVVW